MLLGVNRDLNRTCLHGRYADTGESAAESLYSAGEGGEVMVQTLAGRALFTQMRLRSITTMP